MNTKPWLITAPTIGMILLFGAWSVYWYFLKETARSEFESALARLAQSGVTLNCSERTYSGYPFRVRFDCTKPLVQLEKDNIKVTIKTGHVNVLAQAYKLGHVIVEASGPVEFEHVKSSETPTIPATITKGKIKSKSLRASIEFPSLRRQAPQLKDLEAVSIVSHETRAVIDKTTAWGQKIPIFFNAEKTAIHIRPPRSPGKKGVDGDLALEAINFKLQGGFYTPLEKDQFSAKRFVVNALIRPFFPALNGAKNIAKNWHDLGGAAEIDALLVERDDFTMRAEGVLSLDKDGQLGGSMDAKFLGLENIFNTLISNKVLTKNQAVLASTGLQILSKSSEEEQKHNILTIPVNFNNGQIYFGPHSLGFSPSLF